MTKKCAYTVDEKGIALMVIDNPPMNALDEETMRGLEANMKAIAGDRAVRVVVITGAGDNFVVGADINRVREVNTREQGEAITAEAQGIINLVESCPVPVIAAINGLCLGGGTELALACHLRLASDRAQLGLPEVMLAIMPAFGGTQRAARLIGTARALEMMLTGRFVPAAEAAATGLVNRVCAHESLMEETMKMAKDISYKGPLAVRAILRSVVDGVKLPLDEGLALESRYFGDLAASSDMQEGISAFFEKRRPRFTGA